MFSFIKWFILISIIQYIIANILIIFVYDNKMLFFIDFMSLLNDTLLF